MAKPFFSIITASYNYENYIKETIESVLGQTFSDFEMVIVDDGSKDNSVEIIKPYTAKDSRIKLIQHENNQNKGLIETLKLGIKNSNADWLIFLESDDTITKDHLEKKYDVIKNNNEVKFIFNDVNLFGEKERIEEYDNYFKKTKEILTKNPYPKDIFKFFKKTNLISTFSAVCLKKELLEDVDFNSPIKAILDYYIWIQIAKKTKMYYLDEKLTNWRLHKSYITNHEKSNDDAALFHYKKNLIFQPKFLEPLNFIYYFEYLISRIRKNFIKIHLKERRICLFGHWVEF